MLRDEVITDDFGMQEICPEATLVDHDVEYDFVQWFDDVFERCRTIDLEPGATHYALYKAHGAAPTGTAGGAQGTILPGNSQRATVHCALVTPDGSPEPGYPFDAMIYIDNGRLFFTYSATGGPWSPDERLDRTTTAIDAAGIASASIAWRSDGRIAVVYENRLWDPAISREGSIGLVEGTPRVDAQGRLAGFDWRWGGRATYDQNGEPVFGANPVIAPRVLADGKAQWWIAWAHLAPDRNGVYASQRLSAGIWVALTVDQPWPMVQIDYTTWPPRNRMPVSFDACSLDGTPSADHPTITPSTIDATFATKRLRNAPEGRVAHLAWDVPTSRCNALITTKNRMLRYAAVLALGDQVIGISGGRTEQPHKWVNAQYVWMANTSVSPTIRSHTRPSIAVDAYRWGGSTDQDEPVIAWEVNGSAVFAGTMRVDDLNRTIVGGTTMPLVGVAVNRRGDPTIVDSERWAGRRNPTQFAQLFVAAQQEGIAVDHPSVTGYPADDKTWFIGHGMPAQFAGALAFHFKHPSVGDDIYLGLTYPSTLWNYFMPWAPMRWLHGGLGFTEPHLSCSIDQFTPQNPHAERTVLGAARDANPVDASTTPLYGIHAETHPSLGKEAGVDAAFGDHPTSYLGIDVQVDTLGDAALIAGDVTLTNGGDTTRIDMDFTSERPGARIGTGEQEVFSNAFPLAAGMTVSASVFAYGDSLCLANVASGDAAVTWSVDVIDSATGEVVIPMYAVTIGGRRPEISIPQLFPAFLYAGQPVARACVRMRASIAGEAADHAWFEGLAVHCVTPLAAGLGKTPEASHPFAFTPRSDLVFFPNPTNGWMQFAYDVFGAGVVTVRVFDMLGRVVATPVERAMQAGRYAVALDTRAMPVGTYNVVVMTSGGITGTGTFVVRR